MSMDIGNREGKKVIFNHPDAGRSFDQARAEKHLIVGGVYTVDQLDVDRNFSKVLLEEIPDVWFNTVMFDDCEDVYAGKFGKLRKLTQDKRKLAQDKLKCGGMDSEDVWIIGSEGVGRIHDLIGESIVELKLIVSTPPHLHRVPKKFEPIIKRLEEARELVYQYHQVEEEPGDVK